MDFNSTPQPKHLLFLGDSITDSHRLWMPEHHGLGDGYVHCIQNLLDPAEYHCINKGHDGLTLPGLLNNLTRDCYPLDPSMISILIGINDIGVSHNTGTAFSVSHFSNQYDLLLKELQKHTSAKLCCMGPFLFPHPQEYALWEEDVRLAEEAIRIQAARNYVPFLPLQEYMNQLARTYGYDAVTLDGIHLTTFAHEKLALLWIRFSRSKG